MFSFFKRKAVDVEVDTTVLDAVIKPRFAAIPRGQLSVPGETYLSSMSDKFKIINPEVPFDFLTYLNYFAVVNPDVSQAVRNIVQLGNSGHYVDVTASGKRNVKNALEILKDAASRIYTISAGMDGLVNTLLRQQAITGALSAEAVPSVRLKDGIKEIVLVPVDMVRWVRKGLELCPYEYISGVSDSYKYRTEQMGYLELNPLTYTYYAAEIPEKSPYGIPPLAAVLSVIGIQGDMLKNIAGVVKKVGLVGFLSILLKAPPPQRGESASSYSGRLQSHLDTAVSNITKNFSEGIFVGYKDQHEFGHKDVGGDFRGVPELFQVIEEQVFSAINQDAFMLGRVYSSTESYAGVVFDKMLQTVNTYRRIIKRFIEKVYKLELQLHGVMVDDVTVTFKPQRPLNELHSEQAREKKITNAFAECKAGVISWQECARKLGYDLPYTDEPNWESEPEEKPAEPETEDVDKQKDDEDEVEKDESNTISMDRLRTLSKGNVVGTLDSNYDYMEFYERTQ